MRDERENSTTGGGRPNDPRAGAANGSRATGRRQGSRLPVPAPIDRPHKGKLVSSSIQAGGGGLRRNREDFPWEISAHDLPPDGTRSRRTRQVPEAYQGRALSGGQADSLPAFGFLAAGYQPAPLQREAQAAAARPLAR